MCLTRTCATASSSNIIKRRYLRLKRSVQKRVEKGQQTTIKIISQSTRQRGAGRVRHYIKLIISSLFHPMFRHHHYQHYTTTSNPPTTTTFTSPNLTEPLYNERNEEYGQKTKLSFMTPILMHGEKAMLSGVFLQTMQYSMNHTFGSYQKPDTRVALCF